MEIGICGLGFVGNAIYHCFNKKAYSIKLYDKYKNIGIFSDLLETNILFICLPTLYNIELKSYDLTELNTTLELLYDNSYQGIILIKSTVLPDYCSQKNNIYSNLFIISNPEFLSASTSIEDFENQNHIILGYTQQSLIKIDIIKIFYEINFKNVIISITNSETANLVKLSCNSFYAVKIQYFTEIYLLCQKLNISYDDVVNLMLNNNWINQMHTHVPGHDGNISFGGACFPKDINALNQFMIQYNSDNNVINSAINERNSMRK